MNGNNSVRLKLPGRDEWIQIEWSNQIEIVAERVPVSPTYSYRWEEVDDELTAGGADVDTDTPGRDTGAAPGSAIP